MAHALRLISRLPALKIRPNGVSNVGFLLQSHQMPKAMVCEACRFLSDKPPEEDLKFGGMYDPEDMTPPIPPYVEKQGETIELKRARLLYQSRKRGMLENGLLLSTFAGKYLNTLTTEQLASYDKLINQPTNDWEIYYWVTEAKETPEEFQSDVMEMLKKHARNEENESRIRQPDLS